MRPDKARDFLSWKVAERKVSFATQKQGLNALVFFKALCGMEEVELDVVEDVLFRQGGDAEAGTGHASVR